MQPNKHNLLLLLCILSCSVFVVASSTANLKLDAKLITDATMLQRLADLNSNSSWVFDFFGQDSYTWSPGSIVYANAESFPAVIGSGLTLAIINLGPCAMLAPHAHRANKFAVAIEGTTQTYSYAENNATMVIETLTPGKATIFTKGSMHAMENIGCSRSQLITAFDDTDPGTVTAAYALFQFPPYIVNAAFGNPKGGMSGYASGVPPPDDGVINGSPACLEKCGIN